MPIYLTCGCGQQLEVSDKQAGQAVQCPHCNGVLTAPVGKARPARTKGQPDRNDALLELALGTGLALVMLIWFSGTGWGLIVALAGAAAAAHALMKLGKQ